MEAVRISSAGFPSRLAFRHFFNRYRVLLPALLPRNMREPADYDYRAAASRLLSAAQIESGRWQVGLTKLFLRPGVVAALELARTARLEACALRIQKNFKRFRARRAYLRLLPLLATLMAAARGWCARQRYEHVRRSFLSGVYIYIFYNQSPL